MNRLTVLLALCSATALADTSLPTQTPPPSRAAFAKSCTARLEQARLEAAKAHPIFKRGTVDTIDYGSAFEVLYYLPLGAGYYMASARSPSLAEPAGPPAWSTLGGSGLDLWRVRYKSGYRGWVIADTVEKDTLAAYQALFQRAIDDCLIQGSR
ncbi:MAG: hypothetical protein EXR72_24745 [Myxococcales bacterium]|nr:hypothetical protein [Myxococcales bacterium]